MEIGSTIFSAIFLQNFVHKKIAAHNHGSFGAAIAGVALPNQNFIDFLPFGSGKFYGDVGIAFVVDPFSVAMVTIGIN